MQLLCSLKGNGGRLGRRILGGPEGAPWGSGHSPAGVYDHHQFVPLRTVPNCQLDLPQRRLSQRSPTEKTKQEVTALPESDTPQVTVPTRPSRKAKLTYAD